MCDEVFQSDDADHLHAAPMPPAYTPHVLDARPSRPLASSSTATATSVRVGRELPRPGNTVAETMNMLRAQLSTSRANIAALQSEMAESRSAYDADRMVWQADMDGVYNELASARSDLHQSATHGLALIQANADLSAQVELLTHRLDSLSEVYMQDAVKIEFQSLTHSRPTGKICTWPGTGSPSLSACWTFPRLTSSNVRYRTKSGLRRKNERKPTLPRS